MIATYYRTVCNIVTVFSRFINMAALIMIPSGVLLLLLLCHRMSGPKKFKEQKYDCFFFREEPASEQGFALLCPQNHSTHENLDFLRKGEESALQRPPCRLGSCF